MLSHFKSVDLGFCFLSKSLVMATLGGEESRGVITRNVGVDRKNESFRYSGAKLN